MTTVIALYFYKRVSLKDGIFILTRGKKKIIVILTLYFL